MTTVNPTALLAAAQPAKTAQPDASIDRQSKAYKAAQEFESASWMTDCKSRTPISRPTSIR